MAGKSGELRHKKENPRSALTRQGFRKPPGRWPDKVVMSDSFSTYYQSPIGLLKIAGTEKFIGEILFIDNIEKPATDHRKKISPIMIQCIEQLIEYFNGSRRSFDFPLNQSGTEFQKKVWNELLGIPFGKTISYLELSRRLGDTKAIRAAASASKNSTRRTDPFLIEPAAH
jgi:methylated-DNA-[protein]-cysteine S-methyltransferase